MPPVPPVAVAVFEESELEALAVALPPVPPVPPLVPDVPTVPLEPLSVSVAARAGEAPTVQASASATRNLRRSDLVRQRIKAVVLRLSD